MLSFGVISYLLLGMAAGIDQGKLEMTLGKQKIARVPKSLYKDGYTRQY